MTPPAQSSVPRCNSGDASSRKGLRIYSGDDVQRVSLERTTLSFYHDYKDVFRNMREERLRGKARKGIPQAIAGRFQA
jgi:hypothetical protein